MQGRGEREGDQRQRERAFRSHQNPAHDWMTLTEPATKCREDDAMDGEHRDHREHQDCDGGQPVRRLV
jgi:hypothetical protein